MKQCLFRPFALALTLLTPLAPAAAVPPATPPHPSGRLTGKVIGISQTTISVLDPSTEEIGTYPLAADVAIYTVAPGSVDDLKVGDDIIAIGQPEADGKTLDAFRITQILPTQVPQGRPSPGGPLRRRVIGTIATVTPSLTLKTLGSTSVIIKADDSTQIIHAAPGTRADIVIGSFVDADTSGPDDMTVTEARIRPLPKVGP